MSLCPCGSSKPYDNCCQHYIEGNALAPSAEALMRSRYTAYTLVKVEYILKTTHPKYAADLDPAGIEKWAKQSTWLGLEVLDCEAGQSEDTEGWVTFSARYKLDGNTLEHKERSHFKKEGGAWYYTEGVTPGQGTVQRESPKVGRNDPCPCGSGKKYKKCCAA